MSDTLYRIKPLDWTKLVRRKAWFAETPLTNFYVEQRHKGWVWSYFMDERNHAHPCDSIKDGKAKAEAWYRARLMAALEEVPTCQIANAKDGAR